MCFYAHIEKMESVRTFVHTWKLLHYIPLTSICQDMNRKSSKNSLSYDKKKILFLNNCTFTLVHINYDTCNCSFKNQNWTVKIFRNYICSYFSWLIFLIYFYLAKTPKTHLYTYVVLRLKLLKFKGIESFPSEFLNWLSYLTLTFSHNLTLTTTLVRNQKMENWWSFQRSIKALECTFRGL